jgi:hypothetical protein
MGEEQDAGGKPRKEGEKVPGEELVFYYSRARRLERASEAVRRLNEPGPFRRVGLLKALTANRSGTMVFISIILVAAFIFIFSYRQGDGDGLGGNTLTASALCFSGSTYVAVKKTARNDEAYTGTVDLAVSPVPQKTGEESGETPPIWTQRIFFTLEREEDFRLAVPFEAPELLILMQAGEELVRMRVKTE